MQISDAAEHAQALWEACLLFNQGIVSRGDWLWKQANIKVENNGAVVYVGISLTVRNPLFMEKGLNPGVISKVGWVWSSGWT